MKKRLLSILLALCMLLALLPTAFAADPGGGSSKVLGLTGSEFTVSIDGTRAYTYAYEVAEQVNRLRAGLGLSQLVIDPVLMETAMQRAAECAVYYSHTRPNGSNCFTAFPRGGRMVFAENIAAGYPTPAAAMNGWTNSPGHYANMTRTDVNAMGVGCFYINGIYYWAQAFTGGACSSSSTRENDQERTAVMKVVKEYFAPESRNPGTISLRVGGSYQLPVYTRNPGFSYYTTPLSGVNGATLSAGTNLVKLDSGTLTITAVAAGSGTVTLSLPSGDTLSFAVQVAGRFTDVSPSDWYAGAVAWAVENNITNGTGDGTTFSPKTDCTNEQILTFLYRANRGGGEAAADDMAKAVSWARKMGMIDYSFNAKAPCTRASAVKYIWQALGKESGAAISFDDVSANADYADAVAWAVTAGITDGTGNNRFTPNKVCDRGTIVTFLYRAYTEAAA